MRLFRVRLEIRKKLLYNTTISGRKKTNRREHDEKENLTPTIRKILALVLTLCLALPLLSGLAEEAPDSEQPTVEKLKAKIAAFEQNHPELNQLLPALIAEVQGIHQEEMRMAFSRIQARFEEMLAAEREKNGASEEAQQQMREKLNLQASVLNAGFMAHMKKSFSMMAAVLRGEEYTDDKSIVDFLKELSAEMAASDDENVLRSKTGLDQIIETAEKDYHGDLHAWFMELSARPELPPDAADRPKDDSRPEPPPKGEKPADEGEPKDDMGKPFMDHFNVIREELQAASQQIDARIVKLLESLPEQYQISEETANEISEILRDLSELINTSMMQQLQANEKTLIDSLIH